MKETILSRQTHFQGRRLQLDTLQVRRADGGLATREVVLHSHSVCAAVLTSSGHWVLVRQFRSGAEQTLLEVAGGNLDEGEQPEQAIERELREEIGLRGGRLRHLLTMWTTPGFCNQRISCFLVDQAELGPPRPEEGECLEICLVEAEEGIAMVLDGRISDGASVTTMLAAARFLGL